MPVNHNSFWYKLREGLAQMFRWHTAITQLPNSSSHDTNGGSSDLEVFLRNIYKAYATSGEHTYLDLDLLKRKVSNIYSLAQFDELLTNARQKYPTKIWIDRNAQGKTIIKIVK